MMSCATHVLALVALGLACVTPSVVAIIDATTETACLNAFGRWVTVTMRDSSVPADGWEGNVLHFQNERLEDIHSFALQPGRSVDTASFCLDYYGDQFSKCYTIKMDDAGYNPQQVSWIVKVTTRNVEKASTGVDKWVSRGNGETHGWNPVKGVMEAIKSGGSPADVKVLCGRLFKKLGRYSMRQIDKATIDQMSNEDNMLYKSQSALAKIESQALLLGLYESGALEPSVVDKDDWFIGDATTEASGVVDAKDTTTQAAAAPVDTCADCPDGCTGCAVKSWGGDGQCDDDNNSCGCNWDGGDCCSEQASHQYCTDCTCKDPAASRALRR